MADGAVDTSMATHVREWLDESANIFKLVADESADTIADAAQLMSETLNSGNKILFCGNGGSAAEAQHIAAELIVRLRPDNVRRALAAIALTTDPSIITACANDYDFDRIFARQVEALGTEGDLLYAISTSGNSANVVQAAEEARQRGMRVLAISGQTGGTLRGLADIAVRIPSTDVLRTQEASLAIGHMLCHLVDKTLFNM